MRSPTFFFVSSFSSGFERNHKGNYHLEKGFIWVDVIQAKLIVEISFRKSNKNIRLLRSK